MLALAWMPLKVMSPSPCAISRPKPEGLLQSSSSRMSVFISKPGVPSGPMSIRSGLMSTTPVSTSLKLACERAVLGVLHGEIAADALRPRHEVVAAEEVERDPGRTDGALQLERLGDLSGDVGSDRSGDDVTGGDASGAVPVQSGRDDVLR